MIFVLYHKNSKSKKVLDRVSAPNLKKAKERFARKRSTTIKECEDLYDIEKFRVPTSIEKRKLFKK